MRSMFATALLFNKISFLWNTAAAINMFYLFLNVTMLNQDSSGMHGQNIVTEPYRLSFPCALNTSKCMFPYAYDWGFQRWI